MFMHSNIYVLSEIISSLYTSHVCRLCYSISVLSPISNNWIAGRLKSTISILLRMESIIDNPNIGQRPSFDVRGVWHDLLVRLGWLLPEDHGQDVHGSTEDFDTAPPGEQPPTHLVPVIHLTGSARPTQVLPQSTRRVYDVTSQHWSRDSACHWIIHPFYIHAYNKILNCVSVAITLLFPILDDFHERITLPKSRKITHCIPKASALCSSGTQLQ